MGCDIHIGAEVKKGKDWETSPFALDVDRNGELFALLAGVRTLTSPILPLRGLPPQGERTEPLHFGEGDEFHGATWYTIEELLAHNWDQPALRNPEYTQRQLCGEFLRELDWALLFHPERGPDQVRLVMYFHG